MTGSSSSRFLSGLAMFGMYWFLNSIEVSNSFSFGYRFQYGQVGIPAGFLLISFIVGVGMLFFSSKNYIGWLLAGGSIVFLVAGVIMNLNFHLRSMNAFQLLLMLILVAGGAGLTLAALRK
jgi:uncharacterized protein